MLRAFLPVVLLLVTVGCGQDPDDSAVPSATGPGTGSHAGTWTRLPDSPLSAREAPTGAYVGGEVVIVGGYAGPPCPPTADCAHPADAVLRDGAAYDPQDGTWRRIADAPRPVPELAPTAVLGDDLYVLADDALLVWHSARDDWDEVPVPHPPGWAHLEADGPRIVVASSSDEYGVRPDRVLDTRYGTWSTLPEDPLKPAFDRTLTATPAGLVLTAKAIRPDGQPADPGLVRAAVLPPDADRWQTLPTSDQLGGWRWSWTGQRLVDPTLGGADGGTTNGYGRTIPFGGRLEPATGSWSRLPDAPAQDTGGWPVEARGGPLAAADGWVYDDAHGSWARLARPDGAPGTPGTAVWAGSLLVVHGGVDWDGRDATGNTTAEDVWSTSAWAYEPS